MFSVSWGNRFHRPACDILGWCTPGGIRHLSAEEVRDWIAVEPRVRGACKICKPELPGT